MPVTVLNKKEFTARFEALFEHATTGILITDSNSKIIAANPFACMEFGYSKNELPGKQIETLIPARCRRQYLRYYNEYFRQLPARSFGVSRQLTGIKKDGTEFPARISLSYYRYDENVFIVIFADDISVRKRAEEKIRNLNAGLEMIIRERTEQLAATISQLEQQIKETNEADALLREANRYLNSLLNYAGAMIMAVDVHGIIRLFNPHIEKALGYRAEEVIGKQNAVIFYDKNLVAQRSRDLSRELKRTIRPGFEVFVAKARLNIAHTSEWIYIRKDGTRFPVSLTVTALRDDRDNITGFMGIAFDISDRKKIEEDLRIAFDREKELSELKSRFISMASHEFRTPLSTILSSAYLISKYVTTDDQAKRETHLQRIVSSVNMLTDTLNDFLSVGKIEEGKISLRFTEFTIADIVLAIVQELEISLKKDQNIRYSHTGKPTVMLDSSLLKHIIMNLISNASKFSSEGSPIEISTTCSGDQFTLSVKDYGIGISEDDQKHLMERFFRGTNAANIPGTGLGLHIVSKYAEMMNGTLECKSELKKGSEFIVLFTIKTG